MSQNNFILPIDAFVRTIKVDKNIAHAFLLGAGASITSGIKSAYDCIWDWKREIYLTKNPEVKHLLQDISSQYVRQTIQNWLDNEGGYPQENDNDEYSFYIEKSFPISDTRRQYFQNLVQHKKPFIGYNLLCLLAESEIIKAVWTTNFDGLISKAAANFKLTPIDVGLDSQPRIERPAQTGELLVVSMHGDYRYDKLKNTAEELQNQEKALIENLQEFSQHNHLIISGYSGRDESIMNALKNAFSGQGSGRLYWCGYRDNPNKEVSQLLQHARDNGREAFYVPTEGFDDTLIRLAKHCLPEDKLDQANEIISSNESKEAFIPFDLRIDFTNSVIKSNLFPIKFPNEVFQFKSDEIQGKGVWKKLKEKVREYKIAAAPFKGNIYAISSIEEINNVFNGSLVGEIARTPISNTDLKKDSSHILSLLLSGLTKAIADQLGLSSNGKRKIWKKEVFKTKEVGEEKYNIHKAAILSIKNYGDNSYLSIVPTIQIISSVNDNIPDAIDKEIKRELLDKQWNKVFNEDVADWRKVLFPNKQALRTQYPIDANEKMEFQLNSTPVFTKIMKTGFMYGQELKGNTSIYKQEGIEYNEPRLLFCSNDGSKRMEDTHPIRGILKNKPYDFSLTQKSLTKEISLGVICPTIYNASFQKFIKQQHQQISVQTNKDYLFNFPGFRDIYGLELSIPSTDSHLWQNSDFELNQPSIKQGSLALAQLITERIDKIHTTDQPNIILIFIPSKWDEFCGYSEENERFDLHDFVKAFSAQRGIATQLIREKTITDQNLSCQIHWWLSLSFYSKSLRTPWVLNKFDSETAFAGIGYSVDHTKKDGNVLLGCSHIYNSQGEGLKYKLSKVDNPLIIQDNPHLSREDALRFANSIRQLFWEAMGKMPRRVVIHKRTFFTKEEKQGLIDGLGDIEQIDLIEINYEKDIRYVASKLKNGTPSIDGFPVNRGTCVQLDASTFLLWTHGSVSHAHKEHYKYYKGGRRIPAPLRIKKHYGVSDIGTIANEILGLTKMHWNTFDMYTQLPATIHSSNEIARIGSLLDRFDRTFDYRLFI